ncbi:MAG TPA: molybdopterin cofactor-binding domain-containing protein [Chryseosolibacter sp.]|nr:molybdopterin cofactor-binding domain-containing protein [Chryseosolibacter sp.]
MKPKVQENQAAPEQYELRETPAYHFNIDRRKFFQVMGSGLAIAFTTYNSEGATFGDNLKTPEEKVGAWIHIGEKGDVTIYTGKAEVGQNIRTSLAQIVAEELHVTMDKIDMILGDTDLTPYDRGTFGSRSIPYIGPQLRKAAATAREALIDMAAREWKADREDLFIEKGEVKNKKAKQSVPIGKLTKGKEILNGIDEHVTLTPPAKWTVSGTSVSKVKGESFVTGRHKYVSDMKLPGMLYGKVLRAPSYGATLASVDVSAAKKMKDVIVVNDGDFVGVAAPDQLTATKALAAIRAEWKTIKQPGRSELFEHLKKTAESGSARDNESTGNIAAAYANAHAKIQQTFQVDYIAHAPLEPRAGVAQWVDGKLTVWTGTQRPFGVQEELAEVFNLPKEKIRVIMPDTGSGYGGKHTGEAGIEAARLSKEANRPVKLVWTREEEFTWAYFRPAGVIEVRAGADRNGMLTAWDFHNYNSGGSGIETPYEVAIKKIEFHRSDSPLRQGSYRGLAATANVFARESVMNDLAVELKIDPLDFRLKNLKEERMINVLKGAAEKFGWGAYKQSPGHGIGIACGTEKGSFVATCVEVAFDRSSEEIKVLRAVTAFECGPIINPEHLENQIQGAVVQGLGGALFEWIDFKDGQILNPRFSDYRVPRMTDVPLLETVMINRKDIPSAGAGETPILGIAPAIRNAIAHATGKKLYTLPLIPNGLKV